jgi:hypothetical protein
MMSEKVTFSAFDPIRFDVPSKCDVCDSQAPVFHYDYDVDEGVRQEPKKGFCCRFCASRLLDNLQRAESQVWAQEEAFLKANDVDAGDLEERRLTTFGAGQKR